MMCNLTRKAVALFLALHSLLSISKAQPTCEITYYDEFSGLSQNVVTQAVQDDYGMIWFATWNGLNRYDGYDFITIKPHVSGLVTSDRVRDLRLTEGGHLLCRVDDCWMTFDVRTHIFTLLEGVAHDDESALPRQRKKTGNLLYNNLGNIPNDNLLYAKKDVYGTLWIITRDGCIYYTDDHSHSLIEYDERIITDSRMYYFLTDTQGNVWARNSSGVVKIVFGQQSYTSVKQDIKAEIRSAYKDSKGRIWLAGRDDRSLHVDGNLLPFRSAAYCMAEDRSGTMWIGTKPDGLFRVKDGHTLSFRHDDNDNTSISADNIYDLLLDNHDRLWIATMDGGLNCVEEPLSDVLVFINPYNSMEGYPEAAMSVRRITIVRDSLLMLATTGGLLVVDNKTGRYIFHDETGPIMDVFEDSKGRIFIASESSGIIRVLSDDLLAEDLYFDNLYDRGIITEDIVYSLFEYNAKLCAVSDNALVIYDPENNSSVVYDHNYWKHKFRFSDGRPLHIDGSKWLLGLQDGGIIIDLNNLSTDNYIPSLAITAVSVENGLDSIPVVAMDTLILKSDERNFTVRFAALDFKDASGICYAFRLDDDKEWTSIGETRFVTFLDMPPGEYNLEIRSTDNLGQWIENTRKLTIIVTPHWWETSWARLFYAIIIIIVLLSIGYITMYVESVKRNQRDTLKAYMKLLEEHSLQANEHVPYDAPHSQSAEVIIPRQSEGDRLFMKRVMDYVEANIGVSDLSIADIASAAATSPSGLNRKMKQIVNITPAEFVKRVRLQRAATLLTTTDLPILDIALDCGFSDQNYFAKCFKAANGTTPTDYRKTHRS